MNAPPSEQYINSLIFYVLVVALSLLSTRFRAFREEPIIYSIIILLYPILIIADHGIKEFNEPALSGFLLIGFCMLATYQAVKHYLPRINEAYILIYTLYYWYILIESFWDTQNILVPIILAAIAVYPTYFTLVAAFRHEKLSLSNKLLMWYWFLFSISCTYADQWFLGYCHPLLEFDRFSLVNLALVLFSATQLFFLCTSFFLFLSSIPIFRMSKHTHWSEAKAKAAEARFAKVDTYVDFQSSKVLSLIIIVVSLVIFALDQTFQLRTELLVFYTVVFPVLFFYLKWSPVDNRKSKNGTLKSRSL